MNALGTGGFDLMRRMQRKLGAALVLVTMGTMVGTVDVRAADPTVDLDGSTHVITFTSPPVYDVSTDETSSDGVLDSKTAITQDLKGNIDGIIIDQGATIALTTQIHGTIRRTGGVTVIKEKEIGEGDLGNGDLLRSRGTKQSVVVPSPGGATLHSVLKIKTCAFFKKPFSEKYSKVCNKGGGEHESPFARSGDWIVRVELERSPNGELSGFGTIITNVHSAQFKRETDVIISGTSKDEGLAKMKLSPLFSGGDGPVTVVAQIDTGGELTRYPAILFVISVKGKLLGQKLSEEYDVLR
jgi:hypothetical protein